MDSKNSNPKFTGERHIFHYTFLFDAYTETKMLFQCDVMLMIASPKEDNFRFSLLVTLQSKRSIIYLLERIGEMLRAIFVGLFNEIGRAHV